MPRKPKTPRGQICVATGYGVKIYVERGHLVVHDGIGRNRETRRFHRATSQLSRVVVVGHTGFITLEALRWIRDIGAVLVQIDADSTLVATTISQHQSSSSQLRRAQVLAAESEAGLAVQIELLSKKLDRQAEVAAMLAEYRPTLTASRRVKLSVADAIRAQIEPLRASRSMSELRKVEFDRRPLLLADLRLPADQLRLALAEVRSRPLAHGRAAEPRRLTESAPSGR